MITEYKDKYYVGDRVIVFVPKTAEERDDPDKFNAGFDSAMLHLDQFVGTVEYVSDIKSNGRRTCSVRFDNGESWYWDAYYMRPESEAADLEPAVKDFGWYLNEFLWERLDIDISDGSDEDIQELSEFLIGEGFPEFIIGYDETFLTLRDWRRAFPAICVEEPGKYGLGGNPINGMNRPKNGISIKNFLEKMRAEYKSTSVAVEDFETMFD